MKRTDRTTSEAPSRRSFLRGALLGAAALAQPSFASAARAAHDAPAERTARIGVLLDGATASRDPGERILDGLRLHLAERDGRLADRVVHLDVTRHQTGQARGDTIRRTLETQRPDLLVGVLPHDTVDAAIPHLERHARAFLAIGYGANTVRPDERHPLVTRLTLGAWQIAWAAGRHAAGYGRTAAVITSLRDSGFDHAWAFEAGFHDTGGTSVRRYLTDERHGAHDVARVIDRLRAEPPDVLYLQHGDSSAAAHVLEAHHHLLPNVPLVANGVVTPSGAFGCLGNVPSRAERIVTYHPALANDANARFVRAHRNAYGREPCECAALGYETGHVLEAALERNTTPIDLTNLDVASLRGASRPTHDAIVTPYLARPDGRLVALPPAPHAHPFLTSLHAAPRSGLLGEYGPA